MTSAMEHCEKVSWSIVITGVKEHCVDNGM